MRRSFGRTLSSEYPKETGDIVISVPDSSNTCALGFSQESGVKYEIGLIRNHYVGRTFIFPSQRLRDLSVRLKFNTVQGVLRGKEVIIIDDSIVRGNTSKQIIKMAGRLPDYVVACVGGGSNAIGIFSGFIKDTKVGLVGVEASGEGLDGRPAATMTKGRPGVLHGSLSSLLQDEYGQVTEAHSISAGLDYPGVGPEHSYLKDSERATYVSATDDDALAGFRLLSRTEGIIPALEPAHAIGYMMKWVPTLSKDQIVLLLLSGRGDKDLETVAAASGVEF